MISMLESISQLQNLKRSFFLIKRAQIPNILYKYYSYSEDLSNAVSDDMFVVFNFVVTKQEMFWLLLSEISEKHHSSQNPVPEWVQFSCIAEKHWTEFER